MGKAAFDAAGSRKRISAVMINNALKGFVIIRLL
jgi:hypothetical protein